MGGGRERRLVRRRSEERDEERPANELENPLEPSIMPEKKSGSKKNHRRQLAQGQIPPKWGTSLAFLGGLEVSPNYGRWAHQPYLSVSPNMRRKTGKRLRTLARPLLDWSGTAERRPRYADQAHT